jgi:cation transport ATPase
MSHPSSRAPAAFDLSPRERVGLNLGRAAAVLSSAMWGFAAYALLTPLGPALEELSLAFALIVLVPFAMPLLLPLAMSLYGVVALTRGPHVGMAMLLALASAGIAVVFAYATRRESGMLLVLVPILIAALAAASAYLTWRLRRSG